MVTGTPTSSTIMEHTSLRRSENRRSNKPIMEKRRRARINNCLNELKSLILDALKKDPARHSKLEKADILEMTVKHVESLQRHQAALNAVADPQVLNKFKAGWSECVIEVGKFPGLEMAVKRRLVDHLSSCILLDDVDNKSSGVGNTSSSSSSTTTTTAAVVATTATTTTTTAVMSPNTTTNNMIHQQPVVVGGRIPNDTNHQQQQQQNIVQYNTIQQSQQLYRNKNCETGGILALVPTRLANGDIALVLPSPPPLVPASSQQPLCLAISKQDIIDKPWRPW